MLASTLLFLAIFLLPGVWVGFSPLTRSLDGAARLILSLAFSVPVASIEFEVLRALGVVPETAVLLLAALNLPALALVWRARAGLALPGMRDVLGIALAIALPVAFLLGVFSLFEEKSYWAHTWLHADMIYALYEDAFRPEERLLAGHTAAYPWFGHLFFLIQSLALDLAPAVSFTWVNIGLAVIFSGFAMLTVREMGGGRLAIASAPFLYSFALNPIGNILKKLVVWLDPGLERWAYLLGDPRHDFMLIKHVRLNLNQVGITLLVGLIFLALRRDRRGDWSGEVLIALMVFAIATTYPLYLPVALIVVGARFVALSFPATSPAGAAAPGAALRLAVATGLGAALSFALVKLQMADRSSSVGIELSVPGAIWRNSAMAATAAVLPGLAFLWLGRSSFRSHPHGTTVLFLAALGLGGLSALMHVPNHKNEYKFVFALGLALMPFLCLAWERIARRSPSPVSAVLGLALAAACLYGAAESMSRRNFTSPLEARPKLAFDGFDQNLAASEPLSGALTAIREKSPRDAVMLAGYDPLSLPTFTRRAIYVPYTGDRAQIGIGFPNDFILANVKGYDPETLARRRDDLVAFMTARDAPREAALARISALGRDLVVLAEAGLNDALIAWLERRDDATELYRDGRYVVYMVPVPRAEN